MILHLPTICAWCKLVRVNGAWIELAVEGDATHGICPECQRIHFPGCHEEVSFER
jgi:hypothetical protein